MTQATRTTYLDENTLPFPFCPGCGHGTIVEGLNAALVKLQLDPHDVVIVTDIGCQGLADRHFATNALHGLHGRSITYATGIKLANPDLRVIVLMGDGGCGIGGTHLLNAARRNIGITVLVFNNLNFGMTGGEHSVTTPEDAASATTRYGNLERPLDICGTVGVNGASFVARTMTFDKDLPDLIAQAIENDGFSLLDIWELCTAYFVPYNRFSKKRLDETLERLGYATGIVHREARPEYSRAYRAAVSHLAGETALPPDTLEPRYTSAITHTTHCCIAGAAGKKIGTAATTFSQGAILSGLWVTQRNDYPVTVKTGHSTADVVLSREDAFNMGGDLDLMIVVFEEGLKKERARIAALSEDATLVISADLLPVETRARIAVLDFDTVRQKKESWAMMAIAETLRLLDLYPLDAFKDAVSLRPEYADANLAAIADSEGLAHWL